MIDPDLLTNDEQTSEAHKYAAAAGSFCFVTADGKKGCLQLDYCCASMKLSTIPAAHKLNSQKELTVIPETCWNSAWPPWIDNEVFDLVDLRKNKPKNCVTGRWVLFIKTDKQGNFLRTKTRWVRRSFKNKQKDDLQTDSPASTRPGFRTRQPKSWDLVYIDLKTAFLQGQSHDVNRDVVCQLPPEASHPYIAARLKKPAYGMNDATRRWWNILDKALRSYGMVPARADRCCYVLCS